MPKRKGGGRYRPKSPEDSPQQSRVSSPSRVSPPGPGASPRSGHAPPSSRPPLTNPPSTNPPSTPSTRPQSTRPPSTKGGGRVWLYGRHAVLAALKNPARRTHRLLLSGDTGELPADAGIAPEAVTRAEIDRVLPAGAVHQGLALLTDQLPEPAIEDLLDAAEGMERAVVVALDQVTDPQNVGAVLRSAAVFGALGVIVTERHAPEATGALAKAAAGALETVPVVRVPNLVRALGQMKREGFWAVGLDAQAGQAIGAADLGRHVVLLLGAEGAGLRRLTREHCDMLASLPMAPQAQRGAVDSLNVAAAAAVALYALVRPGT